MVMKYEQDYCVEDGQCLMHRAWYKRYQHEKTSIRDDINTWLIKNNKDQEFPLPREPLGAVEYYKRFAFEWEKREQERVRSVPRFNKREGTDKDRKKYSSHVKK